jgi:hypothetical protein
MKNFNIGICKLILRNRDFVKKKQNQFLIISIIKIGMGSKKFFLRICLLHCFLKHSLS